MRHAALAALIAAGAALSACDAVQVPGAPTAPPAQTPDAAPPPPATPPAETVFDGPAPPPAASQDTETVAADAGAGQAGETDAETVAQAPVAPASLLEVNARVCGLPAGAEATPTVAALAGATEIEEPAFGQETVLGVTALLANYPGIAKLEPRRTLDSGGVSSGHCGATRISERWFITAAHCIDEEVDEIRLVTGSETLSSPLATPVAGARAICHAAYEGSASDYRNDIALIQVAAEAVEDLAQVPIARYGETQKALSPANYPVADMAGWGLTGFNESLSNDLLAATLAVTGAGPATLTIASRDGAGPCIGDSGGPLYVTEADGTKTVIGVLSVVEQNQETGAFCSGDYSGRYTNLQGYAGWIDAVVAACEADPALCE